MSKTIYIGYHYREAFHFIGNNYMKDDEINKQDLIDYMAEVFENEYNITGQTYGIDEFNESTTIKIGCCTFRELGRKFVKRFSKVVA